MIDSLDASTVQYLQAAALLLVGLYGIIARSHLLRKLMAMNILQVAVIVFFIALSTKFGATVPVVPAAATAGPIDPAAYVNPLPHALMLTAIVVSVSTTGVALALLIRIRRRFGTLNEPALLDRLRE
ncbi:MAG: cation:proton antiporter subunit C [Vicinamibacterales bacterium]|jgi:multicomponent Na+:H+ antiporter subunit C|nr:NADH-quinone oxidoreductase subunit J [Acidobacteriota bacterium]MDP6371766.1 cation:proton antiporter subunit C [Vicinamibacterales bacterium]MDP6608551.1 cation:proton antiporter subunit C [Vicinamibacterales bacterium]HAK56854.1 NADH-quinone oxidoreductase subunit J [Acidobacteriota bacterium]|tara:strand:- start:5178 stop:5558 length:381 start_codon:yes stop_codon:yes gene_type:complete